MQSRATAGVPPLDARRVLGAWLLGSAVAALACFRPVAETDLGWHLAVGRRLASDGLFLHRNALSWTFPDYLCRSTSWLFDAGSFLVWSHGGLLGVQWLTFGLVGAALLAVALAAERTHAQGAWLTPLVALMLLPRITPRAFLVSWVLLGAVLLLNAGAVPRSSARRWACVALIAVSSNFHSGGVFAAVALAIYCFEAARVSRRYGAEALCALAGVLALMANPAGPSNVTYALSHLWAHTTGQINEIRSPRPQDLPGFYVLAVVCLVLGWMQRRTRPAHAMLALAFVLGGLKAARVTFEFDLVASVILAGGFSQVALAAGARAAGLLGGLLAVTGLAPNWHRLATARFAARWDVSAVPERAARYLDAAGLSERGFNTFDDGGFLALALPHRRVFQDGRTQAYPAAFLEHELSAQTPEAFDAFLRSFQVEWALVSMSEQMGGGGWLLGRPDWALVYWDERNALLVRRDVASLAAVRARDEVRWFHPLRIAPGELPEAVAALALAEVPGADAEVRRFLSFTPENRFALVAACLLERRVQGSGAAARCDQARTAAREDETLEQALTRAGVAPAP